MDSQGIIARLNESQSICSSDAAKIFLIKLRHKLSALPEKMFSEASMVFDGEDGCDTVIYFCHVDDRIPALMFKLDETVSVFYDTWGYRYPAEAIDYRDDNPFLNPLALFERILNGEYQLTIGYKRRQPFRWSMWVEGEYVWNTQLLIFNWFRQSTWKEIRYRWLPQVEGE